MTPEQAVELRRPFAPESVGKLPRVTCRACRDAKGNCGDHRKIRCPDCGNWITTAHIHLDYVGHAEITDRLLAVDPGWAWEPVAFGQDGLPQMGHGGLWIRLTVAGVTRLGFGSADGKTGPDAVKEMIGDALRNAAMRFGVGLDLWGAKFKGGEDGNHDTPEPTPEAELEFDPAEQEMLLAGFAAEIDAATTPEQITEIGGRVRANRKISPATYDRLQRHAGKRRAELNGAEKPTVPATTDNPPSDRQIKRMYALFRELGITGADQHEFMSEAISPKPPVSSSKQLDDKDVGMVILRLEERKRKAATDATT